ncbi:uncharacterized protein N7479_010675 [Penicillium vulpinum]|uniref:Uncharacterized protein n=1 Tax=Penicillium vulpinum TaxID=29845 RepID=A0A1V6SAA6_9EURO|nr:uncharacterized protein N7479_010675 [Penicillium vulpinum]KAJ5952262.1 hypothetical protein N7479_010675 [Penicillium vulpinum]OQE10513.1 hypothetical protein PENVUL_c004G01972 [Penicillium vulpinum]
MRYNLPTLLALCQDTGVHIKWTSQAKHCRILHPGRRKKPILSETPRNQPHRESARSLRPNKNPASKTSKNRPTRTSKKPSEPVFSTRDAGFAQFLKKHTSPKHQRVTAGGRIVPMEPPKPPRLGGFSFAPRTVMNDDESIGSHTFVDGPLVSDGHNRAAQDILAIIRSSTESDNNLQDPLPSPLLASTSQFAAPVNSQDSTVPQTMDPDIPYAEWIEHQLLDEVNTDFIPHTPNAVQSHEPTCEAEERRARWVSIERLIHHEDTAIAQFLSVMSPFGMFRTCDFYVQYVKASWMCGFEAMIEARSRLKAKLRNHGKYLEEVNEVIALNPQISPDDPYYKLRVYNINERARVLNALDEHDMLMDYAEAIRVNNPGYSAGLAVDPAHRNHAQVQAETERTIGGGSHDNPSTDGTNEVERPNTNRRVEIINPDTGHPIQFQRQPSTTNNNNGNGAGRTNGNDPGFDNTQLDGTAELLIRNHGDGNHNTNKRTSFFNEIQVDRQSDFFHGMNGTSGDPPRQGNDLLFDADSRLGGYVSPEMSSETESIISWIPEETWTERRPRNGKRISETVPRNFGRNVYNHRSPLHSITEVQHEGHTARLASTAADNESLEATLVFSIDEDEVNYPTEENATQNELHDVSVPDHSDEEEQVVKDSRPGTESIEDVVSGLSFDQQRRSTGVLENFFDMFVLDVHGDWEVEESGEHRGGAFTEQSEDGMSHSRNGSVTLTMNGFGSDYPDDMSDTPLLARNSPFGRYSPFGMSPLSRNSPSRLVSRSGARRMGGLSSRTGSRMISSSLDARRRHDARENIRNARRSLSTSSRLIEDLRDEVPATVILGFNPPDSQQNSNYLPAYPQLIDASIRHTAPAIVNISRINALRHR